MGTRETAYLERQRAGGRRQKGILIPVPLDQLGKAPAYSPENTVIGGQQYRWEATPLKPGEGYEDIAKQAFAGNQYAPEGSNLANYTQMIVKQNQGNRSDIVYKPVAVNKPSDKQEQPNQLASLFGNVASGLSSLFG